jgi:hypothetical protein
MQSSCQLCIPVRLCLVIIWCLLLQCLKTSASCGFLVMLWFRTRDTPLFYILDCLWTCINLLSLPAPSPVSCVYIHLWLQVHASHYLALGAAGALLQHLGSLEGGSKVLLSKSVRVVLEGTSRHMQLDAGKENEPHLYVAPYQQR